MTETRTCNMFVYGTLRVGEYNSDRLPQLAGEIVRDVHTSGSMYNRHGWRPAFPVVDFDGHGDIVGDVYLDLPHDHPIVQGVIRMELNCGYTAKHWDEFKLPDGRLVPMNAFNFDVNNTSVVGQRIPGGDWIMYDLAYRAARTTPQTGWEDCYD